MKNRLDIFADFVSQLKNLSKCEDRSVAAIIVDPELKQVLSIGINGGASSGTQCLCTLPGKYSCVHAEINALVKCCVPTDGLTMIVSLSPCVTCASAIVNAKIAKVIYLEEHKDVNGIILLKNAGVVVNSY